jgi:hypothetical protein
LKVRRRSLGKVGLMVLTDVFFGDAGRVFKVCWLVVAERMKVVLNCVDELVRV